MNFFTSRTSQAMIDPPCFVLFFSLPFAKSSQSPPWKVLGRKQFQKAKFTGDKLPGPHTCIQGSQLSDLRQKRNAMAGIRVPATRERGIILTFSVARSVQLGTLQPPASLNCPQGQPDNKSLWCSLPSSVSHCNKYIQNSIGLRGRRK